MFCDGSGKQKVEPKDGEVEEEKTVKARLTWVWEHVATHIGEEYACINYVCFCLCACTHPQAHTYIYVYTYTVIYSNIPYIYHKISRRMLEVTQLLQVHV